MSEPRKWLAVEFKAKSPNYGDWVDFFPLNCEEIAQKHATDRREDMIVTRFEVIEKSAYDKLTKELVEAKEEFENLKDISIENSALWRNKYFSASLESDRYKAALEHIARPINVSHLSSDEILIARVEIAKEALHSINKLLGREG